MKKTLSVLLLLLSLNAFADQTGRARYLRIEKAEAYTVVTVLDPWKKGSEIGRYVLVPGKKQVESLPKGQVIKVPVSRAVIYTSVHSAMVEAVGAEERIAAVCESEYLTSENLKKAVRDGLIKDLGSATTPNIEKMLLCRPDVILATPYENNSSGNASKTGAPIVQLPDYMEQEPLARVEWLRFIGLLFGAEERAESLYREVCSQYESLKALAATATRRPKVMTERKWGSSWGVAAGGSYIARMLADAGADYIFSDHPGSGSSYASVEQVLERGRDADFWLLKYTMDGGRQMSRADLAGDNPVYKVFAPYQKGTVWGCNTISTPYYDLIAIHPEKVLAEFIAIFHPELLPDYKFLLYHKLK